VERLTGFVLSIAGFCMGIGSAAAQLPSPKKETELVAAGYKQLTAAQITAMFIGNTSVEIALAKVGNIRPGWIAKIFWRDERTRIWMPQGGPLAGRKLESIWWMEGNLMCSERMEAQGEGHGCRALYQVDSSLYSCGRSSGTCNSLVRVLPGNPDGI
jgi:hypothetical protein